jgi:hypothetical protein
LNKLEWQEGPFRFYIPFILSSSSSLIESPPYAPDLSILATEPSIDPETGEEIGQHRWVGWEEDLDATDDFCAFRKHVDLLLTEVGLDSEDWRFADTALNFLEKAFLRGDEEQLLWHITTIEAILGEKVDAGLTKLLKTRVGRILGKTPDDQRQIRKNFDALYSLRSDLVHGNADVSNQTIYLGQLGQAREMARALMVWMLEYLRHVRHALPSGSELPSRETILNTVDGRTEQTARRYCLSLSSKRVSEYWRMEEHLVLCAKRFRPFLSKYLSQGEAENDLQIVSEFRANAVLLDQGMLGVPWRNVMQINRGMLLPKPIHLGVPLRAVVGLWLIGIRVRHLV